MSIWYYVTRDGYRYEYLVLCHKGIMGIGMSIWYYVTRDGYRYEYLVLCHKDGYRYEYLVLCHKGMGIWVRVFGIMSQGYMGIGMSIWYYVTRNGYRYEYLVLCHKEWV